MEKRVVFFSHSKKDASKVNTLIEELKKANFDVTRSSHKDELNNSYLERACAFVVCLSVHYCTDDSCHSEFLMLHWQEKPMVPVVLDTVSWPPGDNLFIHRDYFWNLTSLMLDVSGERSSGGRLITRVNTALGITSDEKDESWRVGSPRKSAPSPAALSVSQQRTKDEEIMMQLAMQSAEYQKLASAPPSVSGRERSRSGVNSIDQSVSGSRLRSATSGRQPSSSRRSSLLTVTTMEETEKKHEILGQNETDVQEPCDKMTTDLTATEPAPIIQNEDDSKEKSIERECSGITQTVEMNCRNTPDTQHHDYMSVSDNPPKLRRRMNKQSKSCIIL